MYALASIYERMSKHLDLGPENKEILKLFATWVTEVYFPVFFQIKIKHEIKYGPQHLIKLFLFFTKYDTRIKESLFSALIYAEESFHDAECMST